MEFDVDADGKWVELPECHILLVARAYLFDNWLLLGKSYTELKVNESGLYRAIRKSDGKVFKPARFKPTEWGEDEKLALEEA
jgi:hypothetical protein